jgi:hypothetical protein
MGPLVELWSRSDVCPDTNLQLMSELCNQRKPSSLKKSEFSLFSIQYSNPVFKDSIYKIALLILEISVSRYEISLVPSILSKRSHYFSLPSVQDCKF